MASGPWATGLRTFRLRRPPGPPAGGRVPEGAEGRGEPRAGDCASGLGTPLRCVRVPMCWKSPSLGRRGVLSTLAEISDLEHVAGPGASGEGTTSAGRHVKYLIRSEHGWLNAVGFAAAARRLATRDRWMAWDGELYRAQLKPVMWMCCLLPQLAPRPLEARFPRSLIETHRHVRPTQLFRSHLRRRRAQAWPRLSTTAHRARRPAPRPCQHPRRVSPRTPR